VTTAAVGNKLFVSLNAYIAVCDVMLTVLGSERLHTPSSSICLSRIFYRFVRKLE